MKKWRAVLLILFLTAVIYAPALHYGFVTFDDPKILTENELVTRHEFGAVFARPGGDDYVPLTLATFAVEHRLFGLNPAVYHATNVVLHALNCVLIYLLILNLWPGAFSSAATVALLFCVHPLHVESVAWVTERKDVLCGFFYLAALWFYFSYVQSGRVRFFLLTFLSFVLACLAKPMAVSVPAVLLLIDWFKERSDWGRVAFEKLAFIGVAFVVGLLQVSLHNWAGLVQNADYSLWSRVGMAGQSLLFYFSKLILPWKLSAVYERGAAHLGAADFVAAALAVALFVIVYRNFTEMRRSLVFAAVLFFVSVLPVLNLVPSQTVFIFADRYAYLPSLGFFMVAVAGLVKLSRVAPKASAFVLVAGLISLTVASMARVAVWKSSDTLWSDVLEKYPDTAFAHQNYGAYLAQQGQVDEAIGHFKRAIELRPDFQDAHYNLAIMYLRKGREQEAVVQLREAAKDPNYAEPRYALGNFFLRHGIWAEAMSEYQQALQINPSFARAHTNLGVVFYQLGNAAAAIDQYQKAIESDPGLAEPHINLATIFDAQGKTAEAERERAAAQAIKQSITQ